jgi:hypothetical protein
MVKLWRERRREGGRGPVVDGGERLLVRVHGVVVLLLPPPQESLLGVFGVRAAGSLALHNGLLNREKTLE